MKDGKAKSVKKLVKNKARARGLSRDDAFTACAMDRLLFRLGRSRHSQDFLLKGGVLIASWLGMSHRFTRDIDVLRRRGPAKPDRLRQMFRNVVRVEVEDDGLTFREDGVTAATATRDHDGYDGVSVTVARTRTRSPGRRGRGPVPDDGGPSAVTPPGYTATRNKDKLMVRIIEPKHTNNPGQTNTPQTPQTRPAHASAPNPTPIQPKPQQSPAPSLGPRHTATSSDIRRPTRRDRPRAQIPHRTVTPHLPPTRPKNRRNRPLIGPLPSANSGAQPEKMNLGGRGAEHS